MVSWVGARVLTHQIIYIKNVQFLYINKNNNKEHGTILKKAS